MNIMQTHPHINFTTRWQLTETTQRNLGRITAQSEMLLHIPIQPELNRQLMSVVYTKGAQATTAIEGNTLTEEEIEKIQKGQKLSESKQVQEQEVQNILKAMNQIHRDLFKRQRVRSVSKTLIKSFHRQIGHGLGMHFDSEPGRFRLDTRVVGTYRSPDARYVEDLLDKLVAFLKREFGFSTSRQQSLENAILEAIIAHVYIEWIHPFGDGNGRTGRLVEFYVLLRGGIPEICAHVLANHYNNTRPEYYRYLGDSSKKNDLTAFISYAIQGLRDGIDEVVTVVLDEQLRVNWEHFIYERFSSLAYRKKSVFKRRRDLARKLPIEGLRSFSEIKIMAKSWHRDYVVGSDLILRRDLKELVNLGILIEENGRFSSDIGQLRLVRRV